MLKKVETMEKEIGAIKKSVRCIKNIEELLKKATINTQYVEEEIFIDVKYVEREIENNMIIDSRAPVSLMSSTWFANYIESRE